jgi:hypothetical protein
MAVGGVVYQVVLKVSRISHFSSLLFALVTSIMSTNGCSTLHDCLLELQANANAKAATTTKRSFGKLAAARMSKKRRLNNTAKDDDASLINSYKQMKQALEEDTQTVESSEARQKLAKLQSVYLYGLEKVSGLLDLREAPDAIMPGNSVENKTT